jgi:hypothetical protein
VVFSSPKAGRVVEAGAPVLAGANQSPALLGWLTSAPNAPVVEDSALRLNPGTLAAAALRIPDTATTLRFAVRRGSLDSSDVAGPPPPSSNEVAVLFTSPGVSTAVPLAIDALSTCDAALNASRCSTWSPQAVDVSALRGKLLYLKLEVPPNQFFAPQRDFYWVKDVRVE